MLFLLEQIYNYTNGNPSTLILDKYPIHEDKKFQIQAKEYNINLIYIPSGMTNKCQQLDVNFNGPVKSIGKKITIKELIKDPFEEWTLEKSIKAMILSSKSINKKTIINCFDEACNIK